MEKWSHRNNAGGHIENWFTIQSEQNGAGVTNVASLVGGAGHPEMGHHYVAQHPMDVEKELAVLVLSTWLSLKGFAGPSLEARTGLWGKH